MAIVVNWRDIAFMDIYDTENYMRILYDLMGERESFENISHEEMPTFFRHEVFVSSRPYRNWWFIVDENYNIMGSIAVTRANEIAIAIFKKYRRKGWGKKSIEALLDMYPEIDFLANINPANQKSIDLFGQLGFKHIQNTYKLKRSF